MEKKDERYSVESINTIQNNNINLTAENKKITISTEQYDNGDDEKHTIAADNKKWKTAMTFIALQITLFLGALDGTIISPCLPKIGTEFNAASITVWVSTAYVLTFDSFQPIFSKLSDIFGRKWTLVASVGIFLVGSLLCGVAKTMIMLIISRAIAGIGAAGVFAGVFTIVSELIPLEKRGSYQGIINAVFAFASCVGPLIGGLLTDNATWRWAFFINLPIGGIAVLFIIFFFHETIPKTSFMSKLKRIDYLGTILILISAILFLLALNMGGTMYPWKSAPVIAPLVLSLVFIIIFAVVECKYAVEPIFPPYIFKNQSCVAILLTNFFSGIYFFSVVFYLPNYYQVIKGDSAMWSGIRLLPFQLVISFFSTLAGILISKLATFRIFIWSGCFIITLDMGLLSILDVDTDFALIYGFLIIGSMGMGFLFSSTIIAIQAAADPKDIAIVTGLGNFTRLLGEAVGVAVVSSIINSTLVKELPTILPPEHVQNVLDSYLFIRNGLPDEYKDVTLHVYAGALRLAFYILTPLTGISFISSLFIKHHDLITPKENIDTEKEDIKKQQPLEDKAHNITIDIQQK